ncbi:hypothetical protein VUR80DRAFT_5163 [Thermomyces stellatus]
MTRRRKQEKGSGDLRLAVVSGWVGTSFARHTAEPPTRRPPPELPSLSRPTLAIQKPREGPPKLDNWCIRRKGGGSSKRKREGSASQRNRKSKAPIVFPELSPPPSRIHGGAPFRDRGPTGTIDKTGLIWKRECGIFPSFSGPPPWVLQRRARWLGLGVSDSGSPLGENARRTRSAMSRLLPLSTLRPASGTCLACRLAARSRVLAALRAGELGVQDDGRVGIRDVDRKKTGETGLGENSSERIPLSRWARSRERRGGGSEGMYVMYVLRRDGTQNCLPSQPGQAANTQCRRLVVQDPPRTPPSEGRI